MALISLDRLKTLESIAGIRSTTVKPESSEKQQPDVELKLMRQHNTLRTKKTQTAQPPITTLTTINSEIDNTPLQSFKGKNRDKARALLKHIHKNKDRIRYDTGELQFDGIKAGDSDIEDLISAWVNDKHTIKTPGWKTLMNALEATGASPSLYSKWNKRYSKGDWGALSNRH